MHPHKLVLMPLALALAANSVVAAPPAYGKVDTFQPGKKYNCVPTADRKGWDCAESGKAEIPATAPEPARTTPATTPETPAQEPQKSEPSAAPEAAPTVHSSALPGYLTNSAASGGVQPMPAAAAPKPAPRPRVQGPMIPAQAPAASAPAQQPAAAPAPASAAATTPVPEPPATTAAAPAPVANPEPTATQAAEVASAASFSALGAQEFLDLPADAYTIELTHADSEAALTVPSAIAANVYKLHLRQNEADVWLLLCGPYNDLAAARAARDELAAQGLTPGWPRRVGPLQTELHRVEP